MTQPICKTHWQEIVIFITVINTRNLKSKPCYQICLLLLLLLLFFILFFDPGTQFPGNEKNYARLCNTEKYKNQAGMNVTPPPPSQNSHALRWHYTAESERGVAERTRSSAIAEGPRDASCQLKSCQLPCNSAETTCTTSLNKSKL